MSYILPMNMDEMFVKEIGLYENRVITDAAMWADNYWDESFAQEDEDIEEELD